MKEDLQTLTDAWETEGDAIIAALDKIENMMPGGYYPDWLTLLADRANMMNECATSVRDILDAYEEE